jgi:hypothetical protein
MIALDLAVYRTQLGRRLRATAEVLRVFNVDRGLLFGVILALVVILRPEGILALRFGEPWAARVRRSIHRTAPRFESPPGGTS